VTLYEPRLEAMVPKNRVDDSISLEELATRHQLLVPSLEFRSRALLEESIIKADIEVKPAAERVRLESHMTKNLIRYGWHNKGTVVLPSDIALAWKEEEDCAGPLAKRFKWVPVHHQGKTLTHKVNATIRNEDNETVEHVFDMLQQVAKDRLERLAGAV